MPLYDPLDSLSTEAPAIAAVADLVAETAGAQRLLEAPTAEAARELLILGPWDKRTEQSGPKLTLEELAVRHAIVQVMAAGDEPHAAIEDDAAASCPDEGGAFEVWIRRQVRDVELAEGGRGDVYLWVLDCVSSIARELVELGWTQNTVRVQRVTRSYGPAFADYDEEGAQGVYIEAELMGTWGHLDD